MLRYLMKLCSHVPWTYFIIVNMAHWKYITGEKEEDKERQKEGKPSQDRENMNGKTGKCPQC